MQNIKYLFLQVNSDCVHTVVNDFPDEEIAALNAASKSPYDVKQFGINNEKVHVDAWI